MGWETNSGAPPPRHVRHKKFPLVSMGAWAEGLACADPGARTPIGASGNFYSFSYSWWSPTVQISSYFFYYYCFIVVEKLFLFLLLLKPNCWKYIPIPIFADPLLLKNLTVENIFWFLFLLIPNCRKYILIPILTDP